jgi:hypothetical protein
MGGTDSFGDFVGDFYCVDLGFSILIKKHKFVI